MTGPRATVTVARVGGVATVTSVRGGNSSHSSQAVSPDRRLLEEMQEVEKVEMEEM